MGVTDLAVEEAGSAETTATGGMDLEQLVADPDRVQHLDPRTLLVDENSRDVVLDRAFISSLREFGNLQEIRAVLTTSGQARVLFGHRRTLGAVEAGCATVRVIVHPPGGEAHARAAEVARIETQFHENYHRAGYSDAEELTLFTNLAQAGDLTAGQIAGRLKAPRRRVAAALRAAEVPEVREAVATAVLTLEQGAVLTEFADDPAIYELLLDAAAGRARFGMDFHHVAQEARDDRRRAAAVAAKIGELHRDGVRVIDPPGGRDGVAHLTDLTDPDTVAGGAEGAGSNMSSSPISPEAHAGCAGHAAFVMEGHRDPEVPGVFYVCTSPSSAGHQGRYRPLASSAREQVPDAGVDPEGAAKAVEARRRERRRVVAANKAWTAAEAVRRDWVRTRLLTRKSLPKGAGRFMAAGIASAVYGLERAAQSRHALALELLGHQPSSSYGNLGRDELVTESTPDGRAQVVALALVIGAHEAASDRDHWRRRDEHTAAYLRFLADQGYALSVVEQVAAGVLPVEALDPDPGTPDPPDGVELDGEVPGQMDLTAEGPR